MDPKEIKIFNGEAEFKYQQERTPALDDLDAQTAEISERFGRAVQITVDEVTSGQYTLYDALTRASRRLTLQTPDVYLHCEHSADLAYALAEALLDVPMSASAIEEVWGWEDEGDLAAYQLSLRVKRERRSQP